MKKRKLYIAVPTYTGQIDALTTLSLIRAGKEAHEIGWDLDVVIRPGDSMLARCRNVMVTNFLNSDATDFMFWDADVACPSGTLTRLLSHDLDFVGGCYRSKVDPEKYIYRKLPGAPDEPNPATGLMQVEGIGTGFMRVSRSAIERMVAAYPDLYVDDHQAGRVVWLFDFVMKDHVYYGEDFTFCLRWGDIGGRIWIDTELALHHSGAKTFSGRFGDFLRRRAADRATKADLDAAAERIHDAGAVIDEIECSDVGAFRALIAAE